MHVIHSADAETFLLTVTGMTSLPPVDLQVRFTFEEAQAAVHILMCYRQVNMPTYTSKGEMKIALKMFVRPDQGFNTV